MRTGEDAVAVTGSYAARTTSRLYGLILIYKPELARETLIMHGLMVDRKSAEEVFWTRERSVKRVRKTMSATHLIMTRSWYHTEADGPYAWYQSSCPKYLCEILTFPMADPMRAAMSISTRC